MKSIIALPNDYVVVDIETTGRNPQSDSIIEIAAIRYRNGFEDARFEQLVAVDHHIPVFVTMLTGISDAMLSGRPSIESAIREFSEFIGEDILIGHNIACFDSCFISNAYANHLNHDLSNPCIDTLRISKKILPEMESHSLSALAGHYGVSYQGAHRGGADCEITHQCYQKMRSEILANLTEAAFCEQFKKKTSSQKLNDISTDITEFDGTHPLYQKAIVFTGTLSMTRTEAAQMAADVGAVLKNSVTTKTDYLIVGGQDLTRVGDDGMSSKEEKAYKFNASGKANIKIISETEFLELVRGR